MKKQFYIHRGTAYHICAGHPPVIFENDVQTNEHTVRCSGCGIVFSLKEFVLQVETGNLCDNDGAGVNPAESQSMTASKDMQEKCIK